MRILFSFIFLLLVFSIKANADTTSDLSKLLDATKAIKANFTQIIYDNHGKAVQKSYGRMALQRPGKFRWEIIKPIPQVIIANGKRLWIYDPDLQQVTVRSLQNAAGETPALLLSHVDHSLDQDFTIKELPKKANGLRWFSLTPKKQDNMFAAVEMGFLNDQIHEMHLKDHLGHNTTILFVNLQSNANLPAALFIFKAPNKHVDVIDETRKK